LGGIPVAAWAARAFAGHPEISSVVCAVPASLTGAFEEALLPLSTKIKICPGGATRSESVLCALRALDSSCGIVLVHDGVRPFVTAELISRVRKAAMAFGPALAAVPLTDTLKAGAPLAELTVPQGAARRPAAEGRGEPGDLPGFYVVSTVPRRGFWQAQTPQGFPRELLEEALSGAGIAEATDEASLSERLGRQVFLVRGDACNIKITSRRDLELAELIAAQILDRSPAPTAALDALKAAQGLPCPQGSPGEGRGPRAEGPPGAGEASPEGLSGPLSFQGLRVGQGFDFHAFADDGRPLWLGCVQFPGERGLLGHSDADVLAHALADAILGAAGLGDIGGVFPDTEPGWKGVSGAEILRRVWALAGSGLEIVNADLTVIGERPKVAPRRGEMARALAGALGSEACRFNVKGKTTESLGFLGRGEGLAAAATVLLAAKPA
jgi:2-C-methyl-D-erythritol 4-phosphate cytidylyltransferase/2-C-methyl-D-erythritol 2,4-cyclodiphosphate synthase